ncbi:hypothetical protein [Plesiomonas shigelloides]|uniref:hypothetical protein n=1 Tax=Plesiomonas shigelloides TaxID=703 RepID=UPI0012622FAE|nr:hypothetical protein [Plesiomonas shigelloides]KAB7690713.1 hypothetical protein GBN28_05875 [Plesiomonas shigelloides]
MFAKFPPKVSVPFFYAFITLMYLIRFFVGNIYGIFLLTLFMYYRADDLFGVSPYTTEQLVFWLVSQSETTKTALLSSFITVIGFMLAYATATANWKGQLLANLKLQAAGELDVFFSEYSKLATGCQIYASALAEAVDKIQKNCTLEEAIFLASYNRDQGQLFIQKRQRLVAMGIDVHSFQGRYSTLLLSAPNLKSSLDAATSAVTSINEKLWINVPFHIQGDENVVQTFVNQVNIADCLALKSAVDAHHGELNFSAGRVRGNLMSTVVGFNIWTMYHLYRQCGGFYAAIKERYTTLQKNG